VGVRPGLHPGSDLDPLGDDTVYDDDDDDEADSN
jgi:hypothetical protein